MTAWPAGLTLRDTGLVDPAVAMSLVPFPALLEAIGLAGDAKAAEHRIVKSA